MLKTVAFCLIYALPPNKQFFSHSDRLELQGEILNIVCEGGGGGGGGDREHILGSKGTGNIWYGLTFTLKICT